MSDMDSRLSNTVRIRSLSILIELVKHLLCAFELLVAVTYNVHVNDCHS